jgi:hypothetical protein
MTIEDHTKSCTSMMIIKLDQLLWIVHRPLSTLSRQRVFAALA